LESSQSFPVEKNKQVCWGVTLSRSAISMEVSGYPSRQQKNDPVGNSEIRTVAEGFQRRAVPSGCQHSLPVITQSHSAPAPNRSVGHNSVHGLYPAEPRWHGCFHLLMSGVTGQYPSTRTTGPMQRPTSRAAPLKAMEVGCWKLGTSPYLAGFPVALESRTSSLGPGG
jgi:hypothetical protein